MALKELDKAMRFLTRTVAAMLLLMAAAAATAAELYDSIAYVGTYTGPKSKGIYSFTFNSANGSMGEPKLVGETTNPSFLAIHPKRQFLYAINEVDNFEGKNGSATAFAIEPDGSLKQLNTVSSSGANPCHAIVDASGRWLMIANYSGGNICVIEILDDGSLGKRSSFVQHTGSGTVLPRQKTPLAHCIVLDPAQRFTAVADLGLDKIVVYKFDASAGRLTQNEPPFVSMIPGSGPRHLVFAPNAKHAYVINEMNSTLTAMSYDAASGVLKPIQTLSTLPADFKGENSTAEIAIDRTGRFVYGSNRGHDSIVVYAVNPRDGTLKLVQHQSSEGKVPRSFEIDPTGRFLLAANQASDNIAALKIDAKTGQLSSTGKTLNVGAPVCIKFVVRGR